MVAVDDAGVVLNPLSLRARCTEGSARASAALFEEFSPIRRRRPMPPRGAIDHAPVGGRPASFECLSTVTPSPNNPLGGMGIAESGTIGALPAVQNAVIDALKHLGVRHPRCRSRHGAPGDPRCRRIEAVSRIGGRLAEEGATSPAKSSSSQRCRPSTRTESPPPRRRRPGRRTPGLPERDHAWLHRRIWPTSSSTATSSSSAGTTAFTSPQSSAVAASMGSPVSSICSALPPPDQARDGHHGRGAEQGRPALRRGEPRGAEATRSHTPPSGTAAAGPCTFAMTAPERIARGHHLGALGEQVVVERAVAVLHSGEVVPGREHRSGGSSTTTSVAPGSAASAPRSSASAARRAQPVGARGGRR